MKITLNDFERQYLIRKAREYEKKTKDRFSAKFALMLIAERLEKQLPQVINEVFQEKERTVEKERTEELMQNN